MASTEKTKHKVPTSASRRGKNKNSGNLSDAIDYCKREMLKDGEDEAQPFISNMKLIVAASGRLSEEMNECRALLDEIACMWLNYREAIPIDSSAEGIQRLRDLMGTNSALMHAQTLGILSASRHLDLSSLREIPDHWRLSVADFDRDAERRKGDEEARSRPVYAADKKTMHCDYCGELCDPKIRQGKGHVDDWLRDNDGSYHHRCLPDVNNPNPNTNKEN